MDMNDTCEYIQTEQLWLSLAPCPPPFLAVGLFYEVAELVNLTDCYIDNISVRCNLPPPSTTTMETTTTTTPTTKGYTSTDASSETTTFMESSTATAPITSMVTESVSVTNVTTITSTVAPIATVETLPISILVPIATVAAVLLLLLVVGSIVRRCRMRHTCEKTSPSSGCQRMCTKLLSIGCFKWLENGRGEGKSNSFVDLADYIEEEERTRKDKKRDPSNKTISYISFMEDDFKNLDLQVCYNAVGREDITGSAPDEETMATVQGKASKGAKCKRTPSILKRSGLSRTCSKSNKHVRFTNEDEYSSPTTEDTSVKIRYGSDSTHGSNSKDGKHKTDDADKTADLSDEGYQNYAFDDESETAAMGCTYHPQTAEVTLRTDDRKTVTNENRMGVHRPSSNVQYSIQDGQIICTKTEECCTFVPLPTMTIGESSCDPENESSMDTDGDNKKPVGCKVDETSEDMSSVMEFALILLNQSNPKISTDIKKDETSDKTCLYNTIEIDSSKQIEQADMYGQRTQFQVEVTENHRQTAEECKTDCTDMNELSEAKRQVNETQTDQTTANTEGKEYVDEHTGENRSQRKRAGKVQTLSLMYEGFYI